MIADLLLVAGGMLGGALITYTWMRWEQDLDNQIDQAIERHPSTPRDSDWLD